MPSGAYLLGDDTGPYAVERFSCAPGPAGWRYVGVRADPATGEPRGRVDLTAGADGRPVRLLVVSGGWEVRGGAVGPAVLWRRGEDEHETAAAGFTGDSPAFAVATARVVRLTVGEQRRVRLVALRGAGLAALTVDEAWRLVAVEHHGPVAVERYTVDDLATGERRELAVAGDVVVGAPGVRLEELDGAPTLTRLWQGDAPPGVPG